MKNRLIISVVVGLIIVIIVLLIIKTYSVNKAINDNSFDDRVKGVSTQDEVLYEENEGIYKIISTEEAKSLIAENQGNINFVILDIRTPEEFVEGHIDGAQNVDFYDSFESEITKLDKNRAYLIYCRSGNRSNIAKDIFQQMGFKEIYELDGGYNLWQENR
jgi:rhodanese-related sulfurtransferase